MSPNDSASFTVLNDVSLHAKAGELIALLGPSGCGKTTLLRILAGLERPDQGRILLHDVEVTDQRITDRRVGFVFQHYALFRHMTVTENVAFGLSVLPQAQRPSPDKIQKKVDELLSLVQMRAMADRYPEPAFRRATSTRSLGQSAGRGTETAPAR